MIYLIKQYWNDWTEISAYGWKPIAYVNTEEEAIRICNNGRQMEHPSYSEWTVPEFKYEELHEMKTVVFGDEVK